MISTTKGGAMMSNANLSGLAGQWVALSGVKMLAHGSDLKTVYAQLKGVSLSNVLFAKVPGNETMIL